LIASVESAMGIMNLKEIATADPRLDALIVSLFYGYSKPWTSINR
jgi:citrate lyase beta subunit